MNTTPKKYIVSLCPADASDDMISVCAPTRWSVGRAGLRELLNSFALLSALRQTISRVSVHEVVAAGEYKEIASTYYDESDQHESPWCDIAEMLICQIAGRAP